MKWEVAADIWLPRAVYSSTYVALFVVEEPCSCCVHGPNDSHIQIRFNCCTASATAVRYTAVKSIPQRQRRSPAFRGGCGCGCAGERPKVSCSLSAMAALFFCWRQAYLALFGQWAPSDGPRRPQPAWSLNVFACTHRALSI